MKNQTEKTEEKKRLDMLAVELIDRLDDVLNLMAELRDCCSIYATLKCIQDVAAQSHIPFEIVVTMKPSISGYLDDNK